MTKPYGHNKRHNKNVFNCPVKRPGRENGKSVFRHHTHECPLGTLCEPDTVMGPLVHVSVGDDPRLNPPLPRGTEAFEARYKQRTCTERFFSRVKATGLAGAYRRQPLFLVTTLGHALGIHAKARAGKTREVPNAMDGWLSTLDELIAEHSEPAARAA